MLNRGLVLTSIKALVLLFAIALIVSVYILFNKVFYEFHILSLELQYRKNALILATVIMGRDDLIFKDRTSLHTTFDAEKLDKINGKSIKGIGYPNSFSTITIVDLENGKTWNFYIEPRGVEEKDLKKFLSCRLQYMLVSHAPLAANIPKFLECITEEKSERGKFFDEFPITIKYKGETHLGKMLLTYVQR